MNKSILILIMTLSMACNWSNIKPVEGGYLYPKECHIRVGVIKKQHENYEKATEKLLKSIELKDLALQKSDTVIMKWREESYNQHQRLLKQKSLDSWKNWLYFIGGVGVTAIAVYGAGQLK